MVKETGLNLAKYRIYANSTRFKDRVEFSKECVQSAIEQSGSDKWGLSLSFGKDSLALKFLLDDMGVNPYCVFIASSETIFADNYVEVMVKLSQRGVITSYNLHIIQTDNANYFSENEPSRNWYDATNLKIAANHGEMGWIDEHLMQQGYVGAFVGLRKEESRTRRMALAKGYGGRDQHYTRKDRSNDLVFWYACPLAEWTLQDIGAMCWKYDIPLLETYTQHGLQMRTVARVTSDTVVDFGNAIETLKATDRSRYNKMVAIFPELDRH
jgi:3'-phosphoadenosine 5'-phosphosulfate sulfotransferase (PAPS reductase)/FAD synthetase